MQQDAQNQQPLQLPGAAAKTRRIGIVAAASIATVLVAGLALLVLTSGGSQAPAPQPSAPADIPDENIVDLGSEDVSTEGGSIQLTRRDNPEEIQAEIRYDAIDPVGSGRYEVIEPSSWIFLEDGRLVHVTAREGRVLMVGTDRPQLDSGLIAGDVRITLYPAGSITSDIINSGNTAAVRHLAQLTAESESLSFDLTGGELTTPDILRVTSGPVEFQGRGVRALFSEVKQRLEFLRVESDGSLTYTPEPAARPQNPSTPAPRTAASGTTAPRTASAAPSQPSQASQSNPETGTAPIETLYNVSFAANVHIQQGDRTADADTLEMWLRLLDGSLPDRAFASAAAPSTPLPPTLALAALTLAQTSGANPEDTQPERNTLPVNMTWSGPLEVRPIENAVPPELERDDLFARFTAERTGRVRLASSAEGIRGTCDELSYAATTQRLTLAGPNAGAVELTGAGIGRLTTSRLEADLATGVAVVPAAGLLETDPSAGDQAPRVSRISWADQADFVVAGLDTDAPALQTAIFAGAVDAADGIDGRVATVRADVLRAEFDPSTETPTLTRVLSTGASSATDGRGGTLTAERSVEVVFEPSPADPTQPRPTNLAAAGKVRIERNGESLVADELEAALRTNADNDLEVTDLFAVGGALLTARNGVQAQAVTLAAKPTEQTATLQGEGSYVRRGVTEITGTDIQLDGIAGRVRVLSAGTFASEPAGGGSITTAWTDSMFFDDTAGTLECTGAVAASATSIDAGGARSEDRINAHRVTVTFDATDVQRGTTDGLALDLSSGRRTLLNLSAFGSSDHGRAEVESRRYEPGTDRLTRLAYLEGIEIHADRANQTLDVPTAGRLLLSERPRAASFEDTQSQNGDTLFDWSGSLALDQATGTAHFRDSVRLTHRRLQDGEMTDLECERLTAEVDGLTAESGPSGQLSSATAEGAVYLRSGPRELIADLLVYDTDQGIADASAYDGQVSVFDAGRVTPFSAQQIRWNLTTDRIDVVAPSGVSVPR